MSTDSFNSDAHKDFLAGIADRMSAAGLEQLRMRTSPPLVGAFGNIAASSNTASGIAQLMDAQIKRQGSSPLDTNSFTVRDIENGYLLLHKGREFFCEDFTKLAERVVAVMSAAAMDKMNRPNPTLEQYFLRDDTHDAMRHALIYGTAVLGSQHLGKLHTT